ncbi:NF038122 family metalloprotease [Chamaesiphon sp. VAR_48_metabat_135_sub]|uniref:NF038122 family metalloprotease n=1 Tax=Chamaesiphon sp. VAR_48_metabat_135_sub TaxID=2964699 RepID=UPI00286B94F2|nr:NF038122 family metalloprotease [Chamaesiphon sp. VAR_48_metabat_135_sub]
MKTSIVKIKQAAVIMGLALTGIGSSGAITPANALTFNFISSNAIDPLALAGFQQAGARWSSLFNDNVTIDLKIDYTALDPGILGQAGSSGQTYTYSQVYSALNADKKSADDTLAVNSLSNSSTFGRLINRTSDNPNGSGSAIPYVDPNHSSIYMNTANAKALGLAVTPPTSGADAEISFSNLFTWDFNPNDGINANAYDFVGVATHEIGHALGFVSGVDILDGNSPPVNGPFFASQFTFVNTLDLFRYSSLSKASNVIDWTADARDKYFSLDRGATNIALFSNGQNFGGDGRQASHWRDTMNLGIMDPTAGLGELLAIGDNDKRAFDAIGWDRIVANNNPTEVPEPENFVGTFIFAAFGAKMVLKRRQKLVESSEKEIV